MRQMRNKAASHLRMLAPQTLQYPCFTKRTIAILGEKSYNGLKLVNES